MVRIFKDADGYAVQTTCLDVDAFITDLSEALAQAMRDANGDSDFAALGILSQAMPVAFKLAGYKADQVVEQRTLVCGVITPKDSQVIASAGR